MVGSTLLCSVQQEIESFEGNDSKPQLEASRLRRLEDEGERWGCWGSGPGSAPSCVIVL